MDTDLLRQKYLKFFSARNHKIVPSSPLIPADDPTLLFTSAGMNQFKKEFLGQITDFRRATSCQKCLRTDDLEVVGQTSYHHTFFEMLGNFSFGDYFKEEAIAWAWEFLAKDLKLDPGVLWVSVYQDDNEAYNIWKLKVGFPKDKIVQLGPKDNFWPANAIKDGPNGPCGPCSEIFFDYGAGSGCKGADCRPGCGCGRFVEIWNLVFTQFNRKDGAVLEALPSKNIDTGMGLERMASVLQGVKSNFEIDIFKPIVAAIEAEGLRAENKRAINAIADHIRAITFAIFDGAIPSNEGRGYVIRKLIRKSEFHGFSFGIKAPFLYRLVHTVTSVFSTVYPEMQHKIAMISDIVNSEERLFATTLKSAPRILTDGFKNERSRGKTESGNIAFRLYDTYGMPLEIIKSWAKDKGFEINEHDFNVNLSEQRERSKRSSKISGGVFTGNISSLAGGASRFVGYRTLDVKEAKILRIFMDGKPVRSCSPGETCQIVVDKTPFYAESGGQSGDEGEIGKLAGKGIFKVNGTIREGGVIIHCGNVEQNKFKTGDAVRCQVNREVRQAISRAHTATHLLHAALRQVMGEHIQQSGSQVEPDRLRFDFVHFKQPSAEDLKKIEDLVQKNILSSHQVSVEETTLLKARKSGALAFFQEKYGSKVRVVSVGNFSCELCGGTHLKNSAEVGLFKIVSESSISKGTRRIEALTGELAWERLRFYEEQVKEVSNLLKTSSESLADAVSDKIMRLSVLERELAGVRLEMLKRDVLESINMAETIAGTKIFSVKCPDVNIELLRQAADLIKSKLSSYAVCLASSEGRKAWLLIILSDDIIKKGLDAVGIVKDIAVAIGGGGGGKPAMAQAGGGNIQGVSAAVEKFKLIVSDCLKNQPGN